jgi:hypothetical protein
MENTTTESKQIMTNRTRESWLTEAAQHLKEKYFVARNYEFPEKVFISCGFAFKSTKAIGQCFPKEATQNESVQIFVCPSEADPVRVLAILLHEMIHAHLGSGKGHGREFKKVWKDLGFSGKVTTLSLDPESTLVSELTEVASHLGDYPHSPVSKSVGMAKEEGEGKKESRKIRFYSTQDTKFRVSMSRKLFEEFGAPHDAWRKKMVTKEQLEASAQAAEDADEE